MMDIQSILDNAVKAARQESLKNSPQLTLGELILKLEAVPNKDAQVGFDFEYSRPTGLSSWRGSYCELAIEFDFETPYKTVSDFLKELKEAIGKTYKGYKGGDFVMGKNTPVWVANYGHSGSTGVVDVIYDKYSCTIRTDICEY